MRTTPRDDSAGTFEDRDEARRPARPSFVLWLRRRWRAIAALVVVLGLSGAVLGPLLLVAVPRSYQATAQLMIDPRSVQVFSEDQNGAIVDANAGINFVETQLQLLTSERVLARVARAEDERRDAPRQDAGSGLRPSLDAGAVDPARIADLRRRLTIKRGERSFLVDVTAKASTPERAAQIANDVVKAFMDEDAASRADAGRRLKAEIGGRLADLRTQLSASEAAAEDFRTKRGLTPSGGQLVSEQRLQQAVTALGQAEVRLARSDARVQQLDEAKPELGSLGPLTAVDDMRTISYLIERQSAAREALADAQLKLGPRHPELLSARSRVDEIGRRIQSEFARIRSAARTDLERARGERDSLKQDVATLTTAVAKDRGASVELTGLEEKAAADRKLLATFETRSREADEFSRVSPANVRVASAATPDEGRSRMVAGVIAAIAGGIFGVLLALACVAFWAFLTLGRESRRGAPDRGQRDHDEPRTYVVDRPARRFARTG